VIRDIAGRQNHSVKLAHKLQKKKHRRERGLLVAEGRDLLELAVDAGADVRDVLVWRDRLRDLPPRVLDQAEAGALEVGVCDEEVLAAASALGGAADVVFICGEPRWSLGDVDLQHGVVAFLQEVGDPGNVGTLVRSCVAFGAAALICSPATADPFGPKAMRAGMGAQFLLPVITEVSAEDMAARLGRLQEQGDSAPQVLVADSRGGDDMRTAAGDAGTIVVLGAERRGPGELWARERRVCIPQERFDSLNVAMAGTILLYELSRARGGNQCAGPLGL
jgi:RNA methyltransferase, TrmH family